MKLKTGIIGCGKVGDFHAKAYAQMFGEEVNKDVAIVYSPLNGTGLKPVTRTLKEMGCWSRQEQLKVASVIIHDHDRQKSHPRI